MTPQEQLKIYAAYLPYELEGTFTDLPKGNSFRLTKIERDWDDGIEEIKLSGVPGPYGGHTADAELFKPILYNLSFLTKEIEHEGKVFRPIDVFEITDDHHSYSVEYDHGNVKLIRDLKAIAENNLYFDIQFLPYEVVQRLISWHFNVFGIPAGEFIDKGTLKTESND